MTDEIKVVIIEDHALMREGIKAIISRDEKIKVIGESDNVDEGYDVVINCNPDILLLDIALHGSSGLVLAKRLLAAKPDLLIIIITAYSRKGTALSFSRKEAAPRQTESIISSGGLPIWPCPPAAAWFL